MPYLSLKYAPKKGGKKYGKKTYKRSPKKSLARQYKTQAPTISAGPSVSMTQLMTTPLFPARKYIKGQLYYETGKTLTSTIGSAAAYVFSANGIFDPNITGTGHQPIGFDQMMLMYEQYTVIRSHIKVTFLATDEPIRVAITLGPDATPPSNSMIAMENGLIKSTIVAGAGGDSGTNRLKTLTLSCDVPKYFGKQYQAVLGDTQLQGDIANNPLEQVYFQVLAWDPYGSSATVAFDAVISYDVMYWEPKKLASS